MSTRSLALAATILLAIPVHAAPAPFEVWVQNGREGTPAHAATLALREALAASLARRVGPASAMRPAPIVLLPGDVRRVRRHRIIYTALLTDRGFIQTRSVTGRCRIDAMARCAAQIVRRLGLR